MRLAERPLKHPPEDVYGRLLRTPDRAPGACEDQSRENIVGKRLLWRLCCLVAIARPRTRCLEAGSRSRELCQLAAVLRAE